MSQAEQDRVFEDAVDSFVERYRRGERPPIHEYTAKYPELAGRIERVFPTLVMMEDLGPGTATDSAAAEQGNGTPVEAHQRLGDYRVLRELGRGGMGIVYEAEQESLGRRVALKVLAGSSMLTGSRLARFQRESRAAARLHHTNIVPVFGVGEADGIFYYVMQFIPGQGLDDVLRELRRLSKRDTSDSNSACHELTDVAYSLLSQDMDAYATTSDGSNAPASASGSNVLAVHSSSEHNSSSAVNSRSELSGVSRSSRHYWRRVASIVMHVADALAYAHDQKTLHRDIKPSNLLLDVHGNVWVTDFGLAKVADEGDLTRTDDLVGTLRYMPPEQLDGVADERSDIYSLGLTLYEMLVLQPAFAARERSRLIQQLHDAAPVRPRRIDPQIPRDLETIVLKAIARDPQHRYQTAAALRDDLQRFADALPIKARRISSRERFVLWCRRNPIVAALTGLAAMLLVAVTTVSTLSASWLHDRNKVALANLERALEAERDAKWKERSERTALQLARRRLYDAHLNQARAARWSARAGQRFDSLDALQEAASLANELRLGRQARLELRNEAIACMALVDLRLDSTWPFEGVPQAHNLIGFDSTAERYARQEADGRIVIRRLSDNVELSSMPGIGEVATRTQLLFSPDGKRLAARGVANGGQLEVRLWDIENGRQVLRVEGAGMWHDTPLDFTPDGQSIAVGCPGDSVCLYDTSTGEQGTSITLPHVPFFVRFHPDGRHFATSAGAKGKSSIIRVYDSVTGEVAYKIRCRDLANAVAWNVTGRYLAAAAADDNVYVYDTSDVNSAPVILTGHRSEVRAVAFTHADDLLMSSGWDGTTRFWDAATGEELVRANRQLARAFDSADEWLTYGNTRTTVGRFQVSAGRECRTFGKHKAYGLSFSPDGRWLASAEGSNGIRVWDVASGQEVAFVAAERSARSAVFDPSGEYLFTTRADRLQRWRVNYAEGQSFQLSPPDALDTWPAASGERLVSFSHDGARRAVSVGGGRVVVSDKTTSAESLALTSNDVRFVALSPDGKWVAASPKHKAPTVVWDATTGEQVASFSLRGTLVAFTPDAKWLVTSTKQSSEVNGQQQARGHCIFWNVGSWDESHRIVLDDVVNGRVAFTSDMRLMAVTNRYHITLLDPRTRETLAVLSSRWEEQMAFPYPEGTTGLCFSPDGSQLAVGTTAGIHLWDLAMIRRQLGEMGLDW